MYITMVRRQGMPNRVVMAVKPGGEVRQFIAGFVHDVPDDEADLLLTGEVGLHDCVDGVRRRIFERSNPRAIGGLAPQSDEAMAVQIRTIDALVDSGALSSEVADALKAALPPAAKLTAAREPYLTRCESCRERVRVLPDAELCPNCNQALRKPAADDTAVSTEALASSEDDGALVNAAVLECGKCGYRPGDSGDPERDARTLQRHIKTHKGDDDLP